MAIIIEETKKKTNWVVLLSVVIMTAVLFIGSYVLFFQKPELIEVVVPTPLQNVNTLSKLSFNPESVVKSPIFQLLRQYDINPITAVPGKSNPFQP